MRLHRFYISQPLGEVVVITDRSLLKQWKNVFRYTHGVYLIAFSGDGYDYTYQIDSLSLQEGVLTFVEKKTSYIPEKNVILYLSLIKKDNFELVVQKATELGITKIIPVISARSEKKNLNEERLLKIAVESSEQCFRGNIPEISPIISLSQALEETSKEELSLFLQMTGEIYSHKKIEEAVKKSSSINLFIGPEGGWTEEEESLFIKNGLHSVSLGKTVLRAETAAITASFLCFM